MTRVVSCPQPPRGGQAALVEPLPLVVPAVLVEDDDSDFFSDVELEVESDVEPESLEDFAPDVLVDDFPSVRLSVR
jgi:hypothetical protein